MTTSSLPRTTTRYHEDAVDFVFEALHYTQHSLETPSSHHPHDMDPVADDVESEQSHVSGRELLEGIREIALERYGLLAKWVFAFWGITTTEDFGRIVFDLVEQGRMRKTDRDQLSDFYDVYDFEQALDRDYRCSTRLPSGA